MEKPNNTRIKEESFLVEKESGLVSKSVQRCIPNLDIGILSVREVGGSIDVTFHRSIPQQGVSMRSVHQFNEESGWLALSGKDDPDTRKAASERASISRTKRNVRELALCNPWQFFVTITLSPKIWNRYDPEGLQTLLNERAKAWRNRKVNGKQSYRGFGYLFVPEAHRDGAIHIHGLIKDAPVELFIPYALPSPTPLPQYIVNKIQAGESIFHCTEWDKRYGWNTAEPVRDIGRAGNYIAKYISKSVSEENSLVGNGKRYWNSRNLRRGQERSRFWVPKGENNVADCLKLLQSIATVSEKGRPLYQEYVSPTDEENHPPVVMTAKAIVNQCDASVSDILALLNGLYQRY